MLALGAHPDDIELGCGGMLAKLVEKGVKVRALVFCAGYNGTTEQYDRCNETLKALKFLGVQEVVQAHYLDTKLAESLTDIIQTIENECNEFNPDRVYTMFREDRHQDHRTIFEASIVGCRTVPQILCYETPSSWPNFMPLVFEPVDDYMDKKVGALKLHVSQSHRSYMQENQIRCNARFRGQQVGIGPSEGFIPFKLVL